jgi:hypothetical protein
MADKVNDPAVQNNPATAPAPAPQRSDRKAVNGDAVHVVKADGTHLDAQVIKTRGNNLVDVKFVNGTNADGEPAEQTITSSPLDLTGKKPDTWHFPEEVVKTD